MAVWNEPNPYTEYNDLIKKSMTFQYQLEDLTLDDIRSASTNYLRSCLKEDIDPYVHDMIEKELYVREQRRPIQDSDLIINDWLLKKS